MPLDAQLRIYFCLCHTALAVHSQQAGGPTLRPRLLSAHLEVVQPVVLVHRVLVARHVGGVVVEELVAGRVQVHGPALRHGRGERPLSDVGQLWVLLGVDAQVACILQDLLPAGQEQCGG